MSIKLGNTDINKIYLGATEIKKAYLGNTLIYDKTVSLPDFTGYNLTRFYATFKSNIATFNNMAEMTRGSGIGTAVNIPFSGVDPSYSGIVAVDDTVDWYASKILCQITGHAINGDVSLNDADQWCRGWIGATQTKTEKNGKASFKFKTGNTTTTAGMKGIAIPELDWGNSFSIVSVDSNEVAGSLSGVFNTTLTSDNRFLIHSDRSANKRHATLVGTIAGTATAYLANNILQHDVSTTKIQITTVNAATNIMRVYLDGVFQSEVAFAGNYNNDILRFGANLNNIQQLDGHKQMVGIADAVWSDADCLGITNKLKTQFGL